MGTRRRVLQLSTAPFLISCYTFSLRLKKAIMILTPLIQKAIHTSARIHQTHRRVGSNSPYITHPYSVLLLLLSYTADERVLSAALLHDTVEDSPEYSNADLVREFGTTVALLVASLTEKKIGDDGIVMPWRDRKESYLNRLRYAPPEALLISAADSIHNLRSLKETYDEVGESFFRAFGAPIEQKTAFYNSLIALIEERLQNPIVAELKKAYSQLEYTLLKRKMNTISVYSPVAVLG